jgi:hypothetical protein
MKNSRQQYAGMTRNSWPVTSSVDKSDSMYIIFKAKVKKFNRLINSEKNKTAFTLIYDAEYKIQ